MERNMTLIRIVAAALAASLAGTPAVHGNKGRHRNPGWGFASLT
jgi:hypothetical protein